MTTSYDSAFGVFFSTVIYKKLNKLPEGIIYIRKPNNRRDNQSKKEKKNRKKIFYIII